MSKWGFSKGLKRPTIGPRKLKMSLEVHTKLIF